MLKPYIGITGFMSLYEVLRMVKVLDSWTMLGHTPARHLMAGVLMSHKTLRGIPNRWPGRFPPVDEVLSLFVDYPFAVNLVHYSSDEPMTLSHQMFRVQEVSGPYFHGFQLNLCWPTIGELETYREGAGWGSRIVLQIGERAMREQDNSPSKVADMLGHYIGLIDDILIDPSGGKGQPFDTEVGRPYLRAIQDRVWDLGLGIAGGLGRDGSLQRVEALLDEFPGLSIDAEGRLRNTTTDELDTGLAASYLQKAITLFENHNERRTQR